MAFKDLHEIAEMFTALAGCLDRKYGDDSEGGSLYIRTANAQSMTNLRQERRRAGLKRTRAGGHDRWVPVAQEIRRRGRQPTVASLGRKSRIMELLASGLTTRDVAKAVGVHQSYVSRVRTGATGRA